MERFEAMRSKSKSEATRKQYSYTNRIVSFGHIYSDPIRIGVTVNIPKGNNVLTVSLCNPTNALMTPPATFEYQLWLYFDCYDE